MPNVKGKEGVKRQRSLLYAAPPAVLRADVNHLPTCCRISSPCMTAFACPFVAHTLRWTRAGGVLLMVTGAIKMRGTRWRRFAQTFFLALQRRKDGRANYVVMNDIFRLLDTLPEMLQVCLSFRHT